MNIGVQVSISSSLSSNISYVSLLSSLDVRITRSSFFLSHPTSLHLGGHTTDTATTPSTRTARSPHLAKPPPTSARISSSPAALLEVPHHPQLKSSHGPPPKKLKARGCIHRRPFRKHVLQILPSTSTRHLLLRLPPLFPLGRVSPILQPVFAEAQSTAIVSRPTLAAQRSSLLSNPPSRGASRISI